LARTESMIVLALAQRCGSQDPVFVLRPFKTICGLGLDSLVLVLNLVVLVSDIVKPVSDLISNTSEQVKFEGLHHKQSKKPKQTSFLSKTVGNDIKCR
jgi:hypothetical protein